MNKLIIALGMVILASITFAAQEYWLTLIFSILGMVAALLWRNDE